MPDADELSVHESEEVELIDVSEGPRLLDVRSLLEAYAEEISREPGAREVLESQKFAEEVSGLPGVYAPPSGALLAVLVDGAVAGCVALRRLTDGVGEMKRLYVDPRYRGRSLGFKLVDEIITRAQSLGYARLRLDTLPFMRGATKLYRAFEFTEIPPYRASPETGARYFELELSPRDSEAERENTAGEGL